MDDDSEISRRTLLKGSAALGAGLALGPAKLLATRPRSRAPSGTARRRPNVIVITADDMRSDEARYMPNLQRLVAAHGTTFTAARHNIAECSPARAGFLTGQYSKRHTVLGQRDAFARHNDVHKTVAVWMQSAGYHTGIIGKYFTEGEGASSPPGWDVRRQLAAKNQEQYGYEVWDGKAMQKPELDQGRYLQQEVVAFLGGAHAPFFLWFTPTADHTPYQAPPNHRHEFSRLQWPDRRERDVSDKPSWIQQLSPFPDRVLASIRQTERLRLRELLGLDDTIAAIFEQLASTGRVDDTVVIFTSDNGVFMGEHRIPPSSKNMPYEPSVLVPCVARGPGFPHTTIRQPVHMSMDLTATCVELAEASPNLPLDGVSLTQVVGDPSRFDARQLLYERGSSEGYSFPIAVPPLADGIFTRDRKLVRYRSTPSIYELYDLDADPNELRNLADHPEYADDRSTLEAALDRLLAS
jgi:N-acetylglucosamine-6-sulfatase